MIHIPVKTAAFLNWVFSHLNQHLFSQSYLKGPEVIMSRRSFCRHTRADLRLRVTVTNPTRSNRSWWFRPRRGCFRLLCHLVRALTDLPRLLLPGPGVRAWWHCPGALVMFIIFFLKGGSDPTFWLWCKTHSAPSTTQRERPVVKVNNKHVCESWSWAPSSLQIYLLHFVFFLLGFLFPQQNIARSIFIQPQMTGLLTPIRFMLIMDVVSLRW